MDLEIAGDAALVTASSSGLGKASARALAAEGANVVLNGRDEDRLEEAVADVRADAATDATVVGHAADLTDPDAVDALVRRPIEEFGGLDHLVTSAGGPPAKSFLETTDEEWYEAFDLLVMSVVRTVRAAAPHLRADGGGTIVTIASISVKEAVDDLVLSNSVRMGVVGLEKTLSKELAPEVRANAVLPGTHETPRVEALVDESLETGAYDSYEEGIDDWAQEIPAGHLGDPMDLGRTVAFLSSPQSSYLSGVALPIDGGESASNL
ncbi:SDR family oxidoreductase [Halobellus sp. Atlit-38R]|jgi:3-oxoacyl-[acyl-carrier protein] reductase|uniref:SDR family oxidoreductase n=1 Tax=Halobellus sp. Atlit-38R TaxID=2282131 RepID=UPI000EF17807|nr:SDR family oxidoreductase [Halobellus sp. Atlit-38R]RLM89267.1 SDR family oxidoreductase [Halobellus sp. Atlit-38R]